ncbi:MAG TPA: RnfABCDGE type electron transport complex subunit B [Povalibacter sp.]|nr:RnfABCDGE type electron transport complex subunit B [Povalibacter sp.]
MLAAILVVAALGTLLSMVTMLSDARRESRQARLIERINDLLPQTQCRRCTFDGCKPYATAIARGEAGIDQCPPGGVATAHALATLLMREAVPVDPKFGAMPAQPAVAWIDETVCIGCTKCIQACPVDAIVGASKFMHTVIAAECTGCELCIPPCPVDCILMQPARPGMLKSVAGA